jgi:2-dehydro-3-deoxyphosphogluconate aldolase / (4S)-4-hydroxy-2-oxoglutarate aldolase
MTASHFVDQHPIIPVVVIDDPSNAVDLAHALMNGGIYCAEVTMRTPSALQALALMSTVSGFTAGVGTVRSVADLEAAHASGARFAVSPGFDESIVELAQERSIDILPGVATATEAQHAHRCGLRVVKFFPADRLGGLDGIRALRGPFPDLRFVPSGGVTATTATDYLADPAVPAVSGSWMATRELIAAGDFTTIERLSAECSAGGVA